MRHLALIAALLFCSFWGIAQSPDSLLSAPRTLELTVSTPQPRLDEKFRISLGIDDLRSSIFKSLIGKVRLADDLGSNDNDQMVLEVTAPVTGKKEIGPLEFTIDGTRYTTNKIEFEVIGPLPNVDKGLWFRKVEINDTSFCIIIEQRIPANSKITTTSTSINYTTVPEESAIAKFKESYSIPGLSGYGSNSNTDYRSIYNDKGEEKQFMSAYSVYNFHIVDKTLKIKITKDKFDNIPPGYTFEDIPIR